MTPSARIQAVIEIGEGLEASARPADTFLSSYFRSHRYIGSTDRAAISNLFYELLRHYARLGWWLNYLKTEPTERLRMVIYLHLVEKLSAGQTTSIFSGGHYGPPPLEEAEQVFLKKLKGRTLDHPDMPEIMAVECPEWCGDILKKRFGHDFARQMQAMQTSAPLDLRVNSLKSDREAVLKELQSLGIKASRCQLSPLGIRVHGRPALTALPMLRDGRVEIQDEGSQLVAFATDARPGQRVLDFCAGAGGKTLAMAAMMANKGRIIACDVLEGRLEKSQVRFRRAGIHNIDIHPIKSESDPWLKRHKGSFDRVLVDAPCTGTGTWRRNPDARWRRLAIGLDKTMAIQASILASAARLVKPKGLLVYATCSLLPVENEDQIEKFLVEHTDFELATPSQVGNFNPDGPYLRLTPADHETDGFFAAVLRRKA